MNRPSKTSAPTDFLGIVYNQMIKWMNFVLVECPSVPSVQVGCFRIMPLDQIFSLMITLTDDHQSEVPAQTDVVRV